MADEVTRITSIVEFVALARDPDRITFMPDGRGNPGWRAKPMQVPVEDKAVAAFAAELERGDRVEVTIATDWGQAGLPRVVEKIHRAAATVEAPRELAMAA